MVSMMLPAISLDAAMSVSAALARLARYGLWMDVAHPEAKAWITEHSARLKVPFDVAARRLARSPSRVGVAIRRQWYGHVLWYARHADEVLERCASASPHTILLVALELREEDSHPPIHVSASGATPSQEGVVLEGNMPVAVSLMLAAAGHPRRGVRDVVPEIRRANGGRSRGGARETPATREMHPTEVRAWPLLEAPESVRALVPFEVVVGLSEAQQTGVTGGELTFPAPPGASTIDVTVDLVADGVDAPDGWSRLLRIAVADPTSARVTFTLIGRKPEGLDPVHLTTLDVRYVLGGSVCGMASRPLVIGVGSAAELPTPPGAGTAWLAQPVTVSPMTVQPDAPVADLEIEILKPDGDSTGGKYVCRCRTPHPVSIDRQSHNINLGQDAKTFAKIVIDDVRSFGNDPIVDNALRAFGQIAAEKLGEPVFDALRLVAQHVAPAVPTVLLACAEPYVPWELAIVDPPLDTTRPPYLGAQAVVGRWLRDSAATPSPAASGAPPAPQARVQLKKPPTQPPSRIDVRHMAVMAGLYKATSDLPKLPAAEQEATSLIETYSAVPLAASLQALKQLLDARLERGLEQIGAPDAVHFAGHGEFDPSRQDSSVLFLSDGSPLSARLFRSANYGGEHQPLIFLNACMIGIGGELLGDMGGFPGNCLKGGFGGVLGALWEVDDTVARDIALEFWARAMPPAGGIPEPVAAILRDLRAKYVVDGVNTPVTTYLSYVYYGHPRLTLHRTP